MKTNFLFAAIALATLASCSNDEVVDVNNGNGITFRTSLDKALSRTVTTARNLAAFNVTAIGNSASYFTDLAVTEQSGTWTPAATYYWPNYDLKFYAYAPKTIAHGTIGINHSAQKITGFSPNGIISQQEDLVVACNTGSKSANESTGVAMNFQHALSQIEVKATNSNDKLKVEIIGVKLVGVATTGDFSFPATATATGTPLGSGLWGNLSGNNDANNAYMSMLSQTVTLDATAKQINESDNFMLVPQQLTPWDGTATATGAYLSVLCRISSLDGTGTSQTSTVLYPQGGKATDYAFAAVALDTQWEPGKKYTYTLDFSHGAGKIDPNPTIPTRPGGPGAPTTTSTSSTIPNNGTINTTPGTAGTNILSSPISFTVTVESWSEASDPNNAPNVTGYPINM